MSNLRIPGPIPVPDRIKEAMASEMINHRGRRYADLLRGIIPGLKEVFATENDVLLFSCSGTGGLEAAIVNLFSPGDAVLFASGGSFGDRAMDIARTFGVDVVPLSSEWGTALEPETLASALQANTQVRAVYLVHNETSTGITNPTGELARVVHEFSDDILVVVDAISGMGALPFETDAWGIDVAVAASQKAFACPPGLTMISVSSKAWQAVKTCRMPRFYWDFEGIRAAMQDNTARFTPPLAELFALRKSLELMACEGTEARFIRHADGGELVRRGVRAIGLELFADPRYASNTVTSIELPDGVAPPDVRQPLEDEYNTIIAGGQGRLSDSVVRIGHLGWFEESDLTRCLVQLSEVLGRNGR